MSVCNDIFSNRVIGPLQSHVFYNKPWTPATLGFKLTVKSNAGNYMATYHAIGIHT